MHTHAQTNVNDRLSLSVSLSGLCPFLGDNDNETLNNILACKWNFEEQEFVDTSEEAKDFISRLLMVNKRYPPPRSVSLSFCVLRLTYGDFEHTNNIFVSICLSLVGGWGHLRP